MLRLALGFVGGVLATMASIFGIDWWIMRQHKNDPWKWR